MITDNTVNDLMKPDVSIIMAVHNSAPTLNTAINSIIAQTFQNWELIIINDGSTDSFNDVIGEFNDMRIRVLCNSTNEGLSASLNRGIEAASGEYIARMDADDICYPERIQCQYNQIRKQPEVDLLGCGILLFELDGRPLKLLSVPSQDNDIRIMGLNGSYPLFHPTWMGRRQWFRQNQYDPVFRKAQDFELLLRASPRSKYANLAEVLVGYRTDRRINLRKRLVARLFVLKALVKNVNVFPCRLDVFRPVVITILKMSIDIIRFTLDGVYTGADKSDKPLASEAIKWQKVFCQIDRPVHRPVPTDF